MRISPARLGSVRLPVQRVPRPGRRAKWAARRAAYGTGALSTAAGATVALLVAEAKLARKTIGEPTEDPPTPTGTYGRYPGKPVHLAVIGDSGAAGLGCAHASQTPGALIAGALARDLRQRVAVDVVAVVGARSADLDAQVAKALRRRVDLVYVMVGTNDVTHRVPIGKAVAELGRAVATLRAAGAFVVVGTCPDLGTVKPIMQPLRAYGSVVSRKLAAAQAVAVVENDGVAVSLGDLLAEEFHHLEHLWSPDRFHPSPAGYRRVVDAVLPSLLHGAGVRVPVDVPVSESVQDIEVAAAVLAREPGVVLETVPGAEGAAAAGAGRLTRLVRRLPLVGRGAPDERSEVGLPEPLGAAD